MPIGKNSIKRAVNNGYSNVKTTAPDMENSVVVEPAPVVEKKAPQKRVCKKTVAQKAEPVQVETKKTPVKKAKTVAKPVAQKSSTVAIGEEMPVYLL